MMFLWLILLAVVIWAAIRISQGEYIIPGRKSRDPLDIARERYAKGEITKQEFEQIKKDLS